MNSQYNTYNPIESDHKHILLMDVHKEHIINRI